MMICLQICPTTIAFVTSHVSQSFEWKGSPGPCASRSVVSARLSSDPAHSDLGCKPHCPISVCSDMALRIIERQITSIHSSGIGHKTQYLYTQTFPTRQANIFRHGSGKFIRRASGSHSECNTQVDEKTTSDSLARSPVEPSSDARSAAPMHRILYG